MTTTTADTRQTTTYPSPPSVPRLQLQPAGARQALLDGGWWPRSTDPAAELPGLILAVDKLHGPVTRLLLSAGGWDSHPRRLRVADRVVRIDYFTNQPISLLTGLCDNGARVDLLIVAPDTPAVPARHAVALAATAGNLVHSPQILAAVNAERRRDDSSEDVWDNEGGRLGNEPILRVPARA